MRTGSDQLRCLLRICAGALLLFTGRAAVAAPALDRAQVMPVREIRPGMKGHGLTVFKGTRIERFDIDVISVMPKMNMGKPLILVRLGGGPITLRGAFGMQGMSGSPCYLNNRLIGAFAYAYSFQKEPLGMVTPIEDMVEALDPRLPSQPAGMSTLGESAPEGVPLSADFLAALAPPGAPLLSEPLPTMMRPLAIPVMVSGLRPALLQQVARMFTPFNMAAVAGPGQASQRQTVGLAPGAALGVSLLSGDVDMTGVGTVTYRRGKELLAFGHPMMQLGATNFPVTTAYVHDVISSLQISFKLASPMQTVGTLTQDRPFSVAGRLGAPPPMVPITCAVEDRGTGRSRTYRVRAANHPFLISRLLPIAANQAIFEVHSVPGDTTATVDLAIDTVELGTLRRSNVFFDGRAVDIAAVGDLMGMLTILSENSFQRVNIKHVNMKVTLTPKRDTVVVERIFVPQDRYKPGETVDVGVVLRPYRGESFISHTTIRIPETAAPGRATLVVSGGPAPPPGQVTVSSGSNTPGTSTSAPPAATNVRQLIQRFLERERNDQMVTRLQFPTTTVSMAGESLGTLPANLADVMRSSRATGSRSEREELKSIRDMDRLIGGSQTLTITIEPRDAADSRSTTSGGSSTPVTTTEPAASGSSAATSLSISDDEEEASVGGTGGASADRRRPTTDHRGLTTEGAPGGGTGAAPGGEKRREGKSDRRRRSSKDGSAAGAAATTATAASTGTSTTPAAETGVLGRKSSTWRQTSAADFERGKVQGLAVTTAGELRLAPALRRLCETTEQLIWSVAALGDEVYAGTGNSGLVYRITAGGQPEVFFRTGELQVLALAKDGRGNLYAGTSPGGKLFRIRPNGQGEELFSLNPGRRDALPVAARPPAKSILSLAVGADGTLFAGTSPEGLVYRIPAGGQPAVLFRAGDRHIQSLLAAPDGTLYAGTADSGLVYQIRPDGTARVLHDSDQSAVTGLARDADGNLYAATSASSGSAKGSVLRISPQGEVKTLWEKSRAPIQALVRDEAGTLYAAAGGSLALIQPDGEVAIVGDPRRAQLMALDLNARGELVAGSTNVGAVYRLEPAARGTYESVIHDARLSAHWGEIRWQSRLEPDTTVQVETRGGDRAQPDATWSGWTPVAAAGSGHRIGNPSSRYLQIRVTMARKAVEEGSPRPAAAGSLSSAFQEVSIAYLPQNQAPAIKLSAPAAGDYWKGTQTIRWTGSDPDKDTIAYTITYSNDGKSWTPLGRPLTAPSSEKREGTAAARDPASAKRRTQIEEQIAANPALARFRDQLLQDAEVSAEVRAEMLKRADELIARYGSQGAAAATAAPPRSGSDPKADGTTRESSMAWDTSTVPDGTYRIRVVASDGPSNPSGGLNTEVVSEPIQVANRAPALFIFRKSGRPGTDGSVRIDGLASGRAPLAGAQFRLDGGEWQACEAADGIWDGSLEAFSCPAGSMKPGQHTLEVKAVDAAGNVVTKSTSVTLG